ncbi:hypothetical protein Tco_1256322 [Tanacetum coccineum]
MREGSQNSSAGTLSARYRNPSERPKVKDRLKDNDGNVFGRLGHRRQSAFDRLSDTYSPDTTKSGPDRASSRDHSHSRGHPHRRDSSLSRDRPRSRDRSRSIKESYDNTCSSYRTGASHRYHSRDKDRSRIMKKGKESEASPLSRVYWQRTAPAMEDTRRAARVWFDELPPESIEGYKDLKAPSYSIFHAAKEVHKRSSENPQYQARDGETIDES